MTIDLALEKLIPGLQEIYGDLIDSVILYGSTARGTRTADSDVDVAILLRAGATKVMRDQMLDLVVDLELECGKVLSVLCIVFMQKLLKPVRGILRSTVAMKNKTRWGMAFFMRHFKCCSEKLRTCYAVSAETPGLINAVKNTARSSVMCLTNIGRYWVQRKFERFSFSVVIRSVRNIFHNSCVRWA